MTRRILAVGKYSRGLYTIVADYEDSVAASNACMDAAAGTENRTGQSSSIKSSPGLVHRSNSVLDLLHARLGHSSLSKMSRIPGFDPNHLVDFFCDTCAMCKHHRSPFPQHNKRATAPFVLVHMDLWGPYRLQSVTGAKYFLTIVDDHTRATWTFLLSDKVRVSNTVATFLHYVQNHFHATPRFVRTDNGTEFNKCHEFFLREGIVHQRSMPYTPQQNGIVERKHRHLLDTARSLMFHAGLPKLLWGECILAATYLINRMPMGLLDWKSPYEILHGVAPSYDHLRIIGCLCYAATLGASRDKFDPRAHRCVFVGYPADHKGYKLFSLQSHKVLYSRDVRFYEDIFPFKDTSSTSSSNGISPLQMISFDYENVQAPASPVSISSLHDSTCPSVNEPDDLHAATPSAPFDTGGNIGSSLSTDTPTASEPPTPIIAPSSVGLRRSSRVVSRPGWLADYVNSAQVHSVTTHAPFSCCVSMDSVYPLFDMHVDTIQSPHASFLVNLFTEQEPEDYCQAQKDPRWVEAMSKEIQALESNQTWEMVALPKGKKPIGSKWVYKIKYHPDGTVERFKARLVAKGFNQVEGRDYKHTFSPVAKLATVRVFIALATAREWPLYQLDINNAFLHGYLDEEVYMSPPEGYDQAKSGLVCKLKRSLYGLKQASRQWNIAFTRFLSQLGFTQSKHDYSLFTKSAGDEFTAALVYVDDVLLTGTCEKEIIATKKALDAEFTIKDLGQAKYFLGVELCRTKYGVFLHQSKYIQDILGSFDTSSLKHTDFPFPQGLKLTANIGEVLPDPEAYRRLVGQLLYLTMTRPDISYAVQHLSQFLSSPRQPHMIAMRHLLGYLQHTASKGLFYPVQSLLKITGFSDADWAACLVTRRSLTGYCIFLGHSLVSWKTKKQATVSRSSAEAEYRSMAATTSELLWLSYLLHDLGVPVHLPVTLFCDNKAAQHLAANPCFHERTKHLEIDCHFTRDKVQDGFLQTSFVPSQMQLADVMTKALGSRQHQSLIDKLGLQDLPT
ncbi:hypothetical protein Dimus_038770 [Dionaea muscipula]